MKLPEDIRSTPAWSVVIPFFNEEAGLPGFLGELSDAVDALTQGTGGPAVLDCEVLLINDGSTDATGALLASVCASRAGWRLVDLVENCGQAAALHTGIKLARGRRLILLDGDGQNDPADIPRLLALLDTGVDLAVGVRAERQDGWQRRVMSRLANGVRSRLLGDGVRDSGCGLKAMRSEVAEALIPIRTLYSFIPALAVAAGFRVAEIPVFHRTRRAGESKYGFRQFMFWPLLDMLGIWWFIHRRYLPGRAVCVEAKTCVPSPHG